MEYKDDDTPLNNNNIQHPQMTRMGSGGIIYASKEERARLLNQQRQLSLKKRLSGTAGGQYRPMLTRQGSVNYNTQVTTTNQFMPAPHQHTFSRSQSLPVYHDLIPARRSSTDMFDETPVSLNNDTPRVCDVNKKSMSVDDSEGGGNVTYNHTRSEESKVQEDNPRIDYNFENKAVPIQTSAVPSRTQKIRKGMSSNQSLYERKEFKVHVNHNISIDSSEEIKDNQKEFEVIDYSEPKQMKSFLMSPVKGKVQCYIKRKKNGTLGFPEYSLFLKDGDVFLMSSKKRRNNKTSNYLITMDGNISKSSSSKKEYILGKLRSNFLGNEFQIYDSGINPGYMDQDLDDNYEQTVRTELGAIIYEKNVLGTKGPRRMHVCINRFDEDTGESIKKWQPAHKDEEMLSVFKHKIEPAIHFLVQLNNKQPKWNEDASAYVLNFNGRVTMASVKNFQLVGEDNEEEIILQFGRVAKDEFTMDLQHPMSPFQAFAIVLSSFDSKIACD